MIFGSEAPWAPSRQHQLLRACFHVDAAKARNMADRWFKRFDLNDATYPEHRLLVRLLTRFPDLTLAPTTASRIAGLKRQLWVRGNVNLKTAMPALNTLDEFGILWVLTGAAQWFVQPSAMAREAADIIEIVVPAQAQSAALHMLAQNGWRAEYTSPDASTGPVFTRLSKGAGALKLSKAGPLFALAPKPLETLWQNRTPQSHEVGRVFIPDAAATLGTALGRAHPKYGQDDQWVFDLFNLNPDPKSLLESCIKPSSNTRKIIRDLHAWFYK